jgi:outer membrane protein OmpA-like peptidoglycan-associated protein
MRGTVSLPLGDRTGAFMIAKTLSVLALAVVGFDPASALDLSLTGEAEETIRRSEADATLHLAIGPWVDGRVKSVTVRGPFVQSAWRLSGLEPDTARLTEDLRAQFEAQGYEVLFSCQTAECGGFDFRYNAGILPAPEMYVDLGDFRYLVARKGQGDAVEHLALVVSRSNGTGHVQLTRIGAVGVDRPVVLAEPLAQTPVLMVDRPRETAPGIIDSLDQGLPIVLEDLVFAPGSAQLEGGAFASINDLAAWLEARPEARLVLVGHTDDIGSLETNVKVSRLRAEAVRQKLLAQGGFAPERLWAEGAGFLSPRRSNQTEEGRKMNRRVEAVPLGAAP